MPKTDPIHDQRPIIHINGEKIRANRVIDHSICIRWHEREGVNPYAYETTISAADPTGGGALGLKDPYNSWAGDRVLKIKMTKTSNEHWAFVVQHVACAEAWGRVIVKIAGEGYQSTQFAGPRLVEGWKLASAFVLFTGTDTEIEYRAPRRPAGSSAPREILITLSGLLVEHCPSPEAT